MKRILGRTLLPIFIACACRGGDDKTKSATPKGSAATVTAPVVAPVDERYDSAALGALSFPLSEGTPEARAHFMRGLLALHSFWYDEAKREFQAAIDTDRTMNMAYWGLAMSQAQLLWGVDDVAAAKAALKNMPDPDRLTDREQVWVVALLDLLKADDVPSSRKQFAKTMEELHATFPSDETATFLSIALLSSTRPEDLDHLALRQRAAELAAGVFAKNPKHPGAAHYLIHAYDTPELAQGALAAAHEYAKIAPEAFHARHMPAHIFSRLGMWKDAIASCEAAWAASVAAAQRHDLSPNHHDFHSLSWLVEMSFELGRRADSEAALKRFADAVRAGLGRQHRTLYASQVSSFMMRTGEWSRVDELLAPLAATPVEDPGIPPAAARTGEPPSHCAPGPAAAPLADLETLAVLETRARAASATHDAAKTKGLVAEIVALRAKLKPFLVATQPKPMVERIEATAARGQRALVARAAKNDRALLAVLRESEADVDTSGESNPTAFMVREEIADALLRMKQPKDALASYLQVLKAQPRRARSLLGAARAAAQTGDAKSARDFYQQLLELWSGAEDRTDGLAEARTAVAAAP